MTWPRPSLENPCSGCGSVRPGDYKWQRLRDGRFQVRVECADCGGFAGWAPQTEDGPDGPVPSISWVAAGDPPDPAWTVERAAAGRNP